MGRPELGNKLVCASCAERFYDLNRVPAICPKCGGQQPVRPPVALRSAAYGSAPRRFSPRPALAVVEPVAPDEELEPAETAEVEDAEDADDDTDADIEPDEERSDEGA